MRFLVAGFGEHRRLAPGPFDAVTCLGNSLPHVTDDAALDAALADFRAVLRPGGLLVIQNNNYDAILDNRRRFMGVASREQDGKEYLFFRFFDLGERELVFHVVTFTKSAGAWTFSENSTPQTAAAQGAGSPPGWPRRGSRSRRSTGTAGAANSTRPGRRTW